MENESKDFTAKRNFILQQGLDEPRQATCAAQFSALQFQPRIVGCVVLLGVLLKSPGIFLVLSAVLWWSALRPQWNPFDIAHNLAFGDKPGTVLLEPAPAPRRFAQGMAGTFALMIGILLLLQWRLAAFFLEALFLSAAAALMFGRFCLGSFVFHVLHGRFAFATRTLPWAQDPRDIDDSCSKK